MTPPTPWHRLQPDPDRPVTDGRWRLEDPDAIYADQVTPGMTIWHPDGVDVHDRATYALDVVHVDRLLDFEDGRWVWIHAVRGGPVLITHDWPVRPFTAADRDMLDGYLIHEQWLLGEGGDAR